MKSYLSFPEELSSLKLTNGEHNWMDSIKFWGSQPSAASPGGRRASFEGCHRNSSYCPNFLRSLKTNFIVFFQIYFLHRVIMVLLFFCKRVSPSLSPLLVGHLASSSFFKYFLSKKWSSQVTKMMLKFRSLKRLDERVVSVPLLQLYLVFIVQNKNDWKVVIKNPSKIMCQF